MRKKNRGMPEVVFVGPPQSRAKFKYVLFRIMERDADGTPRKLVMVREDETVHIQGGEEFMTAYVPAHMVKA